MPLRRGFTNLHFCGAVVTNSLSQAVAMTQTIPQSENLDGHAQWEKLHWLPLPTLLIRKKMKWRESFFKLKMVENKP
jgi:hypothetical protein